MSVWYNDPKDGFAKVGNLIDGNDTNSRLDFSEAIFKLDEKDKSIHCYVFATAITDVKKRDGNGWEFTPQGIYFQLRNEDYEKSQGRDKPPLKVTPKPFSQWLYKVLSASIEFSDLPGNCFAAKGFIQFSEPLNSTTAAMVLEGKDLKGKDLTDEMIGFFADQCFSFEDLPVEELQNLKTDQLPDFSFKKSGSGSYGGARGQTELERLRDRLSFIKEACALPATATLDEVADHIVSKTNTHDLLAGLLK